jgi:hypothetical protein
MSSDTTQVSTNSRRVYGKSINLATDNVLFVNDKPMFTYAKNVPFQLSGPCAAPFITTGNITVSGDQVTVQIGSDSTLGSGQTVVSPGAVYVTQLPGYAYPAQTCYLPIGLNYTNPGVSVIGVAIVQDNGAITIRPVGDAGTVAWLAGPQKIATNFTLTYQRGKTF